MPPVSHFSQKREKKRTKLAQKKGVEGEGEGDSKLEFIARNLEYSTRLQVTGEIYNSVNIQDDGDLAFGSLW